MHYSLNAFYNESKGRVDTLRIINKEEYERQGRPLHNSLSTISKRDLTQVNRLYNCPGSGVPGELMIYLGDAENLPSGQDSAVAVTAYDDQGQNETKMLRYAKNEAIDFGNRVSWQYIELNILYENENELTPVQFYSVNAGLHNIEHCRWLWWLSICDSRRMNFTLFLTDSCNCFSGGTCRADGTCDCPGDFGGPHCEYPRGHLRIFARNATNLLNGDRAYINNYSDALLEIQAYDHDGNITRKDSKIILDNLNPVWDKEIDIGVNDWSYFTIAVRDSSRGIKNSFLSEVITYPLNSFMSVEEQQFEARGDGIVTFDYFFEQGN